MIGDGWTLDAVTARIAAVDPSGPVLEASEALTRLHRDLEAAVGPEVARERFGTALGMVVERQVTSRPTPFTPAA